MKCISISNVKFDRESISAIEEIKRKQQLGQALKYVMPFGTMANIFLGNGVIGSSINITMTDFEALAKAMASLPAIQRKVIRDIASIQAIFHTGNESLFWRGVADGCEIN